MWSKWIQGKYPTEPGYYWFWEGDDNGVSIIEIFRSSDGLWVYVMGDDGCWKVKKFFDGSAPNGVAYIGPIKEPKGLED